jgi:hypothetical protein
MAEERKAAKKGFMGVVVKVSKVAQTVAPKSREAKL